MSDRGSPDREGMEVPIAQVMAASVLTASEEDVVEEAAALMRGRGVGCVVVPGPGPGGVAGVFTERDLLMRVVGAGLDPRTTRVGQVMTRDPICLEASTSVAEASELLNRRGFRHVPVLAAGRLAGIVSLRDLFRVRMRHLELKLDEEAQALHEAQELLALDEASRTRALLAVNQRLQQLALTDELTGLYNHRYFVQRLGQEVARARRLVAPLSLVFLDVDHFKRVNDGHGHPAGNLVLQQVAAVLRGAVEDADVLVRLRKSDVVTRYGGEEFAVLLSDARLPGALAVAERIRRGVEAARTVLPGGAEVQVTVSLGVASHPEHGDDPEALIRAADGALYRAKAEGRNRVVQAGR